MERQPKETKLSTHLSFFFETQERSISRPDCDVMKGEISTTIGDTHRSFTREGDIVLQNWFHSLTTFEYRLNHYAGEVLSTN